MNWYLDFEDDLAWVFNEAETTINQFPTPINSVGLDYLNGFNVFKEGSNNNYICYLLPFWLMDIVPIDRETCRRLSLANIFGMLYYFLQDDHMDSTSSLKKIQIPLANLLHLQFIERYSQILSCANTSFLQLYSEFMIDWADAATNEDHGHCFVENPLSIARKSSPLKICSTSACILYERESLIPNLSKAVDLVLTTIQMADDWVDWQDDMLEGNYNSLIDFIGSNRSLEDDMELTVSSVKHALYIRDILKPYVQIAVDQHEQLIKLNIPIPQLILFHHSIVQYLLNEASRIERDRDLLAQGGFHYWISRLQ